MARSKFADAPLPEEERSEYERWLPGSHRKMIRLDELHEHPDNWELVGRIDESRKKSLTEDVKKSGIREDLQVWVRDGKLVVVSGHERMNIARELGIDELPCVKVDFKNELEAKQHIYAVNANRKIVKRPAEEVLEELFPPEEYPLLYADLRANYSYDDERRDHLSGERTDLLSKDRAREKREKEREEQAALRKKASKVIGRSEEFTRKAVNNVAQKAREAKPAFVAEEPREPTSDEVRDFKILGIRIKDLAEQIEAKEEQAKALRREIRELKKDRERQIENRAKLAWLFPGEES